MANNPQYSQQQYFQAVGEVLQQGGGTVQIPLEDGTNLDLAFNIREEGVPEYQLPDPLAQPDGKMITSTYDWYRQQRPRILEAFASQVYGRMPETPVETTFETLDVTPGALNGTAVRKQVRVTFNVGDRQHSMDLLVYLPAEAASPVPVVLGLNFMSNHTIHPDPGIILAEGWIPDDPPLEGVIDHRATDASRGTRADRWPVEMVLARGIGLATIYSGDLDPDYDDGFQNGVHPLFYREGQTRPASDEWGSIGAWSWGLMRALDYFETDADIDHTRVTVVGHSRLGKAALWAGAMDERFACVLSNESGCGGAALNRRRFGETVAAINLRFPHWFCGNFQQYNEREDDLPVDQHMLLALMAPRPLYVASAAEDLWADPRGEFLALKAAEPVYALLGKEGLPVREMPSIDSPAQGRLGYHIRSGAHDITAYDWQQYLDFITYHLMGGTEAG